MTVLRRPTALRLATLAALAAGVLLLVPSAASPAPRGPIPIPLGWWIGKVNYAQRVQNISGVKVTITKGALQFYALSTFDATSLEVTGELHMQFHATAELNQGGVSVTGEFDITGDFDLEGPPDAVWADGTGRMKGVVLVNGIDVPVDQVWGVSGPITLKTATCTKITGSLPAGPGGSTPWDWSAKRIWGPPCK